MYMCNEDYQNDTIRSDKDIKQIRKLNCEAVDSMAALLAVDEEPVE